MTNFNIAITLFGIGFLVLCGIGWLHPELTMRSWKTLYFLVPWVIAVYFSYKGCTEE